MSRLSHGTWTRKSAQCAFIAVFNKVKAPGAGILSRRLSLAVIGVLLCGGVTAAHAQNEDLKDALLKKLNDQFVLTKMTADGMDVVTAGSTVTLHRDGLQMCSVQAKLPMPNVYRDGKISAGKFAWALSMGMVQPNLPSSQVPIRPFVADEKFWVTAVGVEHNEVVFKFYSDAYQDVRYYAQLAFPFNKKSAPSADDLSKMIAEVVTAEPPSTSQEKLREPRPSVHHQPHRWPQFPLRRQCLRSRLRLRQPIHPPRRRRRFRWEIRRTT